MHQRGNQMVMTLIIYFVNANQSNHNDFWLVSFNDFVLIYIWLFSPLYSRFYFVNCSLKKKWACCEKSFTENDFLFRNLPTTVKIFMAIQVIKLLRIVITLRIVSHDENWFHMPVHSSRPKSSIFFMKHSIALKHI